jgi:hypothetical protein
LALVLLAVIVLNKPASVPGHVPILCKDGHSQLLAIVQTGSDGLDCMSAAEAMPFIVQLRKEQFETATQLLQWAGCPEFPKRLTLFPCRLYLHDESNNDVKL